MTCDYCGKPIEEKNMATFYASGEPIGRYCSSYCMANIFKKATALMKGMLKGRSKKRTVKKPKKSGTSTVVIPLINKHHSCSVCKKYQPRKRWCKYLNKPTKDCSLDCKPKPEWEKTNAE